jgi:hypothetical protein
VARARVAVYRDAVAGAIRYPPAADWVREFFDGREGNSVSTAFLDQFAVRDVSRHVGARLRRRLSTRRGIPSPGGQRLD